MRRPCPGRARLLLALLIGVCGAVLPAAPASAHTALSGSNPSEGARVVRPLAVVALAFNRAVGPDLARVVVTGPDGRDVALGAARVSGVTVTQVVGRLAVPGRYVVAYRVLADDGHPITGRLAFTASGAAVAEVGQAGQAGQAGSAGPGDASGQAGAGDAAGQNDPGGAAAQDRPPGAAAPQSTPPVASASPAPGPDAGPLVPLLVAALAAAGVGLLVGAVRSARRAGTVA